MPRHIRQLCRLFRPALGAAAAVAIFAAGISAAWSEGLYPLGETTGVPRLSDKPLPYKVVPERPELPIELGCKFLGRGNLPKGIRLPHSRLMKPSAHRDATPKLPLGWICF